jgi:hypothetical protein
MNMSRAHHHITFRHRDYISERAKFEFPMNKASNGFLNHVKPHPEYSKLHIREASLSTISPAVPGCLYPYTHDRSFSPSLVAAHYREIRN